VTATLASILIRLCRPWRRIAKSHGEVSELRPGNYILSCNVPNHFANGMWTVLTVTEYVTIERRIRLLTSRAAWILNRITGRWIIQ